MPHHWIYIISWLVQHVPVQVSTSSLTKVKQNGFQWVISGYRPPILQKVYDGIWFINWSLHWGMILMSGCFPITLKWPLVFPLLLRSPTDRQFGWSPACFAALRGDTQVLHQLLAMKVSVNDKVKADEKDLNINKGSSLLHICAQFCNNVAGPYWFAEMWPTKLYSKIEHTQTRIT